MIAVSNGWVNAHKETILPEMFLEITYAATEPGLQQSASSTATDEISFSEAAQVVSPLEKNPEKYATLEHGLWGLDGTFDYFDGSPEDPGYIANALTGADAVPTAVATITVTFDSLRTTLLPGITIVWSEALNEWASEFRVTAWANEVAVAQRVVTDNASPVSPVWMDLLNYNRITIEILKWSLPYHRARCQEVFMGIRSVYTKSDLMGFTHTQSADLLSAALPKNEITFRLRNDDQRWNPDNPTGVEQYLLTRQEVRVKYGMTVDGATEWIPGGTFWLTEWSTPSNGLEANFTARDALAFMEEEYTGPKSGALYDIALAVFEQAGLPLRDDGSPRYRVYEGLRDYTTDFSGENDQAYTMAQVLQMVGHAGNCTIHQDCNGVFLVEPWEARYDGYIIEPRISYTHPEYTISKPLKAVSVGYGDEQDEVLVKSDTTTVGEVLTAYNVFLRTAEDARRVGEHTRDMMSNRKVISGDFRADVRLEALDNVVVTSKYASNVISITDVSYSTTGGTFRGHYTGRVVSVDLKPDDIRVNEFYAGEV